MNLKNYAMLMAVVFYAAAAAPDSFCAGKPGNEEDKPLAFSSLKYADVGEATKKGKETILDNQLEMMASGTDIWGTQDEFRFGYKKIKGDFDLSVQILSLSAANLYTKAGIMAREEMTGGSRHVYFQVFPDNSARNNNNGGCEFQYRLVPSGEMKAIYPGDAVEKAAYEVDFPNTWIRMKRRGDVFESYFSNDNKTWKLYASFTLKMSRELYVGLAVTSHNPEGFTTAGFSSARIGK
ncbi:MAG: DUF1349 domain-containing protein [Bacteroidales bacterium]|nr:DUF1349 domain-containing protein [Bacteroidales bacterium]